MNANIIDMDSRNVHTLISKKWPQMTWAYSMILSCTSFVLSFCSMFSFLPSLILIPSPKEPISPSLSPPTPQLSEVSRNYKARRFFPGNPPTHIISLPPPIPSTYRVGQTVTRSQETPGWLMFYCLLDVLENLQP